MRIGPLGIWEILVIVGVALLIFGPTQLPKIARGVGKAFKSARDLKDEVTGAVLDDEAPKRPARRSEPRVDAEPVRQAEPPAEAAAAMPPDRPTAAATAPDEPSVHAPADTADAAAADADRSTSGEDSEDLEKTSNATDAKP